MNRGKIILALPAYNESENLRPLVAQAREVFGNAGYDYEILVVDDGSSDSSPQILKELATESPAGAPLVVVTHPQNRGLGAAIRTLVSEAVKHASGDNDVIVCMDADNTHDPAYVPGMAEKIWSPAPGRTRADVVIASRFQEGSQEVGVPFGRRILSRGARLLFRIFLRLPDVRDYTCGFRAYRAPILRQALEKYGDSLIAREGFACTDELLVKLSTLSKNITEVPFVLRYDKKRSRSKLPLMRTIFETLKMLVTK